MMDPIRYPIRTAVTALVIAAAAAYPGEAAERDCAPGEVHAAVDGRPLTPEEKIARMDEALRESLARFDECQAAASVSADGGSGVEGAQGNAADGGGSGRSVGGSGRSVAGEGGDGGTAQADGTVESVAAEGVQGTEAPEEAGATVQGGNGGTAQAAGAVESVAAEGVQGTEAPEEAGATVQGGDGGTAQAAGTVESVAAEGIQGTEAPEEAGATVAGSEQPTRSGGVRSDTSGDIPDDIPEPDNDSVLEAQIRRAAMEETDPRIRAELWNEYRKYKGLPERPIPDDDGEPSDAQNSE